MGNLQRLGHVMDLKLTGRNLYKISACWGLNGEPSPVPTRDPLSRKSTFIGINKAYVCALSCLKAL